MGKMSKVVIAVVIVGVVLGLGWAVGGVVIGIQKSACSLANAGINQIRGDESATSQTKEACLGVVEAAAPATRLWGLLFSGILTAAGLMTLFAAMM